MAESGDTIIILPPDKIATIMEEYFNSSMFKEPLHVTDLKASDLGYAFTLSFSGTKAPQKIVDLTKIQESKPVTVRKKA